MTSISRYNRVFLRFYNAISSLNTWSTSFDDFCWMMKNENNWICNWLEWINISWWYDISIKLDRMKIESSIQKSKSTQFTPVLGLFFWTQFRLTTQDGKYQSDICTVWIGIYKAHSTKSTSLGALTHHQYIKKIYILHPQILFYFCE